MRKLTPTQRRMAFGRMLASRVREREISKDAAQLVMEDFAQSMARTEVGERAIRRAVKRAYRRAGGSAVT